MAPGTGTLLTLCGESALCVCDDCLLGLDDRDEGLEEKEPRIACVMELAGQILVREGLALRGAPSSCGDIWPEWILFDLWLDNPPTPAAEFGSSSIGDFNSREDLDEFETLGFSSALASVPERP